VGNDLFETAFLVSSQLTNEAIIGCQLLKEYGVSINSDRGNFSYVQGSVLREHLFATKVGLQKVISDDRRATEDSFHPNNTSSGQRLQPPSPDCESNLPTKAVHSCSNPTPHQSTAAGTSRGRDIEEGIPVNYETQSRSKEIEVSDPLINVAESDQFNKKSGY
jgi:hypothetical protein